jgi:hypothetical protein
MALQKFNNFLKYKITETIGDPSQQLLPVLPAQRLQAEQVCREKLQPSHFFR